MSNTKVPPSIQNATPPHSSLAGFCVLLHAVALLGNGDFRPHWNSEAICNIRPVLALQFHEFFHGSQATVNLGPKEVHP